MPKKCTPVDRSVDADRFKRLADDDVRRIFPSGFTMTMDELLESHPMLRRRTDKD